MRYILTPIYKWDTAVERGWMICPRSVSQYMMELRLISRPLAPEFAIVLQLHFRIS